MDIKLKDKSIQIGKYVSKEGDGYYVQNGIVFIKIPQQFEISLNWQATTIDGVAVASLQELTDFLDENLFRVGGGDGSTGVASVSGTLVNNTDPANPVIGLPTWAQVSGKPTTFAPASHTHPFTDITGTAVAGQI